MKIMRPLLAAIFTVVLAVLLLAATERQAMAYTDPGTGSLIVQALFAALAGALFQFRRISAWFKSRSGPKG
jgi:nitrate/nitrite transporter NarK